VDRDFPVVRGAASFDSFFNREYRSVLALAIVLTGNRETAEELTQDAFLSTYIQWCRVGSLRNPEAWVRRVVANRSVSAFRRAKAEARALYRLSTLQSRSAASPIGESVDVWNEVRRLPRRQAQVIALTYLEGLPRRDVAAILGCGEETVKTHLQRARSTLARRLGTTPENENGS